MKNTLHYNSIVRDLRYFFQDKKGFIEVPAQSRLSILTTGDQPETLSQFTLANIPYPLPQSSHMWLEYEMLTNPDWKGVFCITTSYRDEGNPVEGRHQSIFPLFEFAAPGGVEDLKLLEDELLLFLGFEQPISMIYEDACKKYEAKTIESQHEAILAQEIGSVISLEQFPSHSHPFWNTKYSGNGIYNKIDILLHGMETIGSAERETDKDTMREEFFAMNYGKYSQFLFSKFGRERVIKELDEYLSLDMVKRFGGEIGITRLARALELSGMLKKSVDCPPKNFVIQPELTI